MDPSELLQAMYYQAPGAVRGAQQSQYFNPTHAVAPGHYNQQFNPGVAGMPGVSAGGMQFPTDMGNALNARGVGLNQTGQFLNKYGGTISSLLSSMMRPMGNVGFQTNYGQSAGLQTAATPHA